MKKTIFALVALAAVAFTGCKKDNDEPKVTIVGRGFDISKTVSINSSEAQAVKDNNTLVIDIASPTGIANMYVTITTTGANFGGTLNAVGLGSEFDLAHLEGGQLSLLTSVGLPNNDAVLGKKTLEFNISGFVPMMNMFIQDGYTTDFKVRVVDASGIEATRTLTVDLINDTPTE